MNLEAPIYGLPAHIENTATALAALGAAGSLIFCVRHALRHRSPLALYLFLGGALTIWIEPFPDTLGHAIFAQVDRIPWVSALDRHIPAYIGLTHMFYLAPAYLWMVTTFEKGITPRRFGQFCAVMVTATFAFEFVPLHYDLWRYYGPQGLQVGDMPIWWGFTNSHGIIGAGVIISLLLKVIPANRRFVLVPVIPVLFLAAHSAGSTLGYLALNSTTDPTVATLGTLGTCGLITVLFWLYSKAVCRPAAEPGRVAAPSEPAFV